MAAGGVKAPKLELVPIDGLEPHPDNPNEGDVGVICDLIVHNGWFGQTMVQVREGQQDRIFVGEHRWRALQMLQSQGGAVRENGTEQPLDYPALIARAEALDLPALPPLGKCLVQRYAISDRLARRHMLADNRASQLGTNDDAQLAALLASIAEDDGLVGTGFGDDDLDDLLRDLAADEAKGRPKASDDIPDRPEKATTKLGDLIQLGPHRLLCADSCDPDSFSFLLGDERVDMVWTDPPYGVSYKGGTAQGMTIENDDLSLPDLERLLAESLGNAAANPVPVGGFHVATPARGDVKAVFCRVLDALGVWRQEIIWVKNSLVLGQQDYHWRHEAIIIGWVPGAAHTEPPDRKQDTIWEIDRPSSSEQHPTMKPVELVARGIRNHTKVEALILDPFAGSGTTLMACEQEGRRARCIEIDPGYCDVICARWEKHTGAKAQRP